MNARQWGGFLALTFIWGSSFLWIKLAVQEVGPLTVVTLRLAFAVLALAGFVVAGRSGAPGGVRMWGVLLLQGLMSTAIPWVLITWAERTIASSMATVLNATTPLFTVVIAHAFVEDERMTRRRAAGLAVGFLGVVVLMKGGASDGGQRSGPGYMALLSQGAMLLSSLFYGASNVYARVKLRRVRPMAQAFYTMLLADAVMWCVTPVLEGPFTFPQRAITWIAVGWLGVLGAGLGYVIFYYLIHSIGPTRVSLVTYTIPVIGVTLGVAFLNETLDWTLVAGAAMIVSSVWSVNRR